MPKKTRQDKIIAQLKRQLATQPSPTNTFSNPVKSEENKEDNKLTYTLNAVSSTSPKTLVIDPRLDKNPYPDDTCNQLRACAILGLKVSQARGLAFFERR
jgi:hypothetical protein